MWLDTIFKYIPIIGSIRKIHNDQEIIKIGLQSLLRSQMLKLHREYKEYDEVPFDIKREFQDLYNSYHLLGGNGIMTNIYDEFIGR